MTNTQDNNTINIVLSFKKDELMCCVCCHNLDNNIYQCPNGPHYLCLTCSMSCKQCPLCQHRTQFVRAIYLEENLKKYIVPCNFVRFGCDKKIFEWDNDHSLCCQYKVDDKLLSSFKQLDSYDTNALKHFTQSFQFEHYFKSVEKIFTQISNEIDKCNTSRKELALLSRIYFSYKKEFVNISQRISTFELYRDKCIKILQEITTICSYLPKSIT